MIIAILAKICAGLITIYEYILIARIALSWFPGASFTQNRFVSWIFAITNPALDRFAQWFSFLRLGFLDFSPLLLFITLEFLRNLFLKTYYYHQLSLINF